MGKWILLILAIASSMTLSCGGKKLKDPGSSGNEILFVNDTSGNTYRIIVVGTDADFTLRASTRKSVRVPIGEEDSVFNINIERIEGNSGEVRVSVGARAGDTVRIIGERLSFGQGEDIKIQVESP